MKLKHLKWNNGRCPIELENGLTAEVVIVGVRRDKPIYDVLVGKSEKLLVGAKTLGYVPWSSRNLSEAKVEKMLEGLACLPLNV